MGSGVLAADLASWNVSVLETDRFGEMGRGLLSVLSVHLNESKATIITAISLVSCVPIDRKIAKLS